VPVPKLVQRHFEGGIVAQHVVAVGIAIASLRNRRISSSRWVILPGCRGSCRQAANRVQTSFDILKQQDIGGRAPVVDDG
jgi:hypothetical protein